MAPATLFARAVILIIHKEQTWQNYLRVVASLDRKRLGADGKGRSGISIRGVFDKETRRKPLAFAADAVRYGI